MATEMRREATLWESGLKRSLHEMRCWTVLYARRRYEMYCAKLRQSRQLAWYREQLDVAHDMLLSAKDNAAHMARAIRATNLRATVYEENADDRAWAEAMEEENGYYGD